MDQPESSAQYLSRMRLDFYIQQALSAYRSRAGELQATPDPVEFLAEHFTAVSQGLHVEGQSFELVSATDLNRRSFLAAWYRRFGALDARWRTDQRKHGQLQKADDFAQVGPPALP